MQKEIRYTKGSEWQKWDLHIHTPLSIIQNYGGDLKWDKFISALENLPRDVKVIGITDYYFIDGYCKVMQYKAKGRLKNLEKIFPILEFRIDTFGSGNQNNLQKINLHILLDLDESDLEKEITKVKNEFICQIPITKLEKHKTKMLSIENLTIEGENNLQTGFSNLIPSTDKVFELINSPTWKDKTFILLGYKEWSNLEKNNQLRPLKEDLYEKVKAFFSSNESTIGKSQNWLNEYGNKKLLHSGDIHDFTFLDTANKDENDKDIKSEKYICNTWIKADPTFEGLKSIFYEPDLRVAIQSEKPEEKSNYQIIEKIEINYPDIFNSNLSLNPYLNSIIGGRSTGKSLLLASISKKLKTDRTVEFDDKKDYEGLIKKISDSLKIYWKDGIENSEREIEFFRQGYMYDIARNNSKKDELIQKILSQKGKETILHNYYKSISENKKKIINLINDLFQIDKEIKEKEVKVRDKGDKEGILAEIKRLDEELSKISTIEISGNDKEMYRISKEKIEKITLEKKTIISDIQIIKSLKDTNLFKENISYDLTSISDINTNLIEDIFTNLKTVFEKKWKEKLDYRIIEIEENYKEKETEIEQLSVESNYLKVSRAFKDSSQFSELDERINKEKEKLLEINNLISEINELKEQNITNKENLKLFFKKYQTLSEEVVNKLSDSVDDLKIESKVYFDKIRYRELLNLALHKNDTLNNIYLSRVNDFAISISNPENDILEVLEHLLLNKMKLKGGYNSQTFTNILFSENYYKISYDLIYDGDNFEHMSEGKKAFVILKLLLDFSNKKCPILIDQPEDDLDNRAIYTELVKYLRKKKLERQIILVTHNPNIVVGADSELVIVANQNGIKNKNTDGKKFQYISGSLENTIPKDENIEEILNSQGIREHVCDILEGGTVAFLNREMKYAIK